jgi:hypothetical protein
VTYLQRYTLLSALGLATADQDDDGQAVSQRKPVAMPTPRKAQAAPAAPAVSTPTPATETAPEGGVERISGVVEAVKESKTAKGGPRYGVKLSTDARWFGTFDKKLGEAAKFYHNEGMDVTATGKARGEFWDLVELDPAEHGKAEQAAVDQEPLPFN